MHDFVRQRLPPGSIPATVESKWGIDVLVEGFVPFPKRFLRCLHQVLQGPDALLDLAVILTVADYLRPNLKQWPSVHYLAFVAGLPIDVFRSRLESLAQRGLLSMSGSNEELRLSLSGLQRVILEKTTDGGETE